MQYKQIIKTIFILTVLALILAFVAWFINPTRYWLLTTIPGVGNSMSQIIGKGAIAERYNLAYYYFADEQARDLDKAQRLLSQTLSNTQDEKTMMLLSRVYFAQNELGAVIQIADRHLDEYPELTRMHYIRGLAFAYENRLDLAEQDFTKFLNNHPNEWAGYLDLSWVHFRKGELAESREVIEAGYARFPDNPWVASAFGVVMYNRGDLEKARFLMEQAVANTENLSLEEWMQAYTAQDPNTAESDFALFTKTLEYNLSLVSTSSEATLEEIPEWVNEVPFADPALRGVEYGLHVSACNSSCPACNECGDCQGYATGNHRYTYHSNQSCAPPALPTGYGQQCFSADNVCAQNNEAVIGCDGCAATVPEAPVPNPDGYVYVPQSEQIYIYEADSFADSELADTCYSFNNGSGQGIFIPLNSQAEFEAFVESQEISENPDFELNELVPSS